MKEKLLINLNSDCDFWNLNNEHLDNIKKHFPDLVVKRLKSESRVADELKNANFYLGWNFDKNWIKHAKKLELIISPAAGKDHFPLVEIEKSGIIFSRMSGFHGVPMVQQIMGYILGFARGLFVSRDLQTRKEWWKEDIKNVFFDLDNVWMTIVGYGSVGKQLSEAASVFGIKTIGIKRNTNIITDKAILYEPKDITQAFKKSKIIVNLLPLTNETVNFFDKSKFAMMNKGSVFINIGRGKTVDEKALIEALDNGIISWCGLDVYSRKPPLMSNKLRSHSNVVMTPKTAVFCGHYMDFAVDYFIMVLKKYYEIKDSINSKYGRKEYINIALKKYFNSVKIENLLKLEENSRSLTLKREELLKKFKNTGRNHPYLAFTVNSICNRNCVFCNPKNRQEDLLKVEDYRIIAREAAKWDIKKVHISGGEPTLRPDIVDLIKILKCELGKDCRIGITTHGNIRSELVDKFSSAGLTDINVSIHSLNQKNYKKIMGLGDPKLAIEIIEKAIKAGLKVKINCVLLRSFTNDALEVLRLAKKFPVALRFIELQNIGPAKIFFDQEYISQDEFFSKLSGIKNRLHQIDRKLFNVRSPGEYYKIKGFRGSISFISNTSRPFCADGNRIKVTPSGIARPCTLGDKDINLKKYITEDGIEDGFIHLFKCILNRDCDPSHRGFHYIDYDLRWDNVNC